MKTLKYYEYINPVMRILESKYEYISVERLCYILHTPQQDRGEKHELITKVEWALNYLKYHGYVNHVENCGYQLTRSGKTAIYNCVFAVDYPVKKYLDSQGNN